eukprot:8350699-Heterocapsa_arctica.AAC.1
MIHLGAGKALRRSLISPSFPGLAQHEEGSAPPGQNIRIDDHSGRIRIPPGHKAGHDDIIRIE